MTGIAVAEALDRRRRHLHATIAATATSWRGPEDVDGLIAEVMGKQTGVCGGRGGSQHLCARGLLQQRHPGRHRAGRGRAWRWRSKLRGTGRDRRRVHRRRHARRGRDLRGVQHRLEMAAAAADRAREQPLRAEHAAVADAGRRHLRARRGLRHRDVARPTPGTRRRCWRPPRRARRGASRASAGRASCGSTPTASMAHSKGDDDRDPAEIAGVLGTRPARSAVRARGRRTRPTLAAIRERSRRRAIERRRRRRRRRERSRQSMPTAGTHVATPVELGSGIATRQPIN